MRDFNIIVQNVLFTQQGLYFKLYQNKTSGKKLSDVKHHPETIYYITGKAKHQHAQSLRQRSHNCK